MVWPTYVMALWKKGVKVAECHPGQASVWPVKRDLSVFRFSPPLSTATFSPTTDIYFCGISSHCPNERPPNATERGREWETEGVVVERDSQSVQCQHSKIGITRSQTSASRGLKIQLASCVFTLPTVTL